MFLQNGFNDFLSKPIDTVKLNFILGKWIKKEKQKGATVESVEAAESIIKEPSSTIEIEGLNVQKGTVLSGGETEYYLDTLALFYKDGLAKISEIKKCLEAGNLSLYTIYVHALKSASANIGADALSETAKVLEAAGERNDTGFIEKNNGLFLTELETLLSKIHDTLSLYRTNTEGNDSVLNIEVLKSDLVNLKTAINELDAGTINETIEKLRVLAQGDAIGDIIASISDDILIAEYDNAIASIDALLSGEK
jgi:HPt (histidine-containing phosphotransfer) domain-containing protein